ncbi:MAG: regulatory protein GemA, partial [Treponema sp.]|nr:regulatory protein GemA [Treponema sp.]
MNIDKKGLARIHAMKKEADISDEDYRVLLSGAAGVDSAKDIKTRAQYNRVIKALSNILAAQGNNRYGRRLLQKTSFEQAVCAKAKRILGSNWHERLTGYLGRINKTALADCDGWE